MVWERSEVSMVNGKSAVCNALEGYKENEMIFSGSLYRERLEEKISEAAYYKVLERMCKAGELVNVARGTYHLPKKSGYGVVPLSEKDIVSAFTTGGKGTVVGYSLYNRLGLTTQVGKTVEVLSSALEGERKTIRNVKVRRVNLEYSDEHEKMIHALEILQNFDRIQDLNYPAFIRCAAGIAENYNEQALWDVLEKVRYKKSTLAFLREILEHYGKPNRIGRMLSGMSEYKHPRMEEIYAAARV